MVKVVKQPLKIAQRRGGNAPGRFWIAILGLLAVFALPGLVQAQTCPSAISSLSPTSCWVPPNSGTTIGDLVDSNPLTIASGSTYGLVGNNTIGCGTGSSAEPNQISSGCNLTSNVSYSPSAMTVVMQFSGTGGPLAQFASTSSTSATYQYFELYLDTFGRLTWGAYNYGSLNVLQTGTQDRPKVYADGNPHVVVASIGANGMRLYVDGSLVGDNNIQLANYATGYWLFGNANLTGTNPSGASWPYGSSQTWFNGTLGYWAWWPSQLTDAQAEAISNGGTNPPTPITNNYTNLTGQLASLSLQQGLAFANQAVTFHTEANQLPACSSTIPLSATTYTYYTDSQGNLPSNVNLPQGAHVNMTWANNTIPLIMPCMSSITLAELIPAQNPLPDAVGSIVLAGPLYQGTVVSNPAVGTIGPATLTSPVTAPYSGAGGTVTVNRNLGPQSTVTLTANSTITFSNLEDGAPPFVVDVIQGGSGGYTGTFSAPAGYTLTWPGGTQPTPASTSVGVHAFYTFTVEGTAIFGSLATSSAGSGTFPLTQTANFNYYSGININSLTTNALAPPTPSVTATCTGTCATTYTYEITCLGDNSTHSVVSSQQTGTNASSLSGSNNNTINWSAGTGCYGGYNVYGRIGGSLGLLANVPAGTLSYTDTGAASPGAAPPTSGTTGAVNVGGNLSVTGTSTLANATVGGTLQVTGTSTLTGGVAGNLAVAGALASGTNTATGGKLTLNGSTSGSAAIAVPAAAGTPTALLLPTTNATAGQFLQNDGSANLSWATPAHGQQLISSTGSFTVPSNIYSVMFECWGPGGGGGGFGSGPSSGGNGSAATTVVISATTYCSGGAGTGGGGVSSGAGQGGAAGVGSSGTLNLRGQAGFSGFTNDLGSVPGGMAPRGNGQNSGSVSVGAGGEGGGSAGSATGGGGGGAGGYSEAVVTTTPGTVFTVTVGTGGTAGGGGTQNGIAGDNGAVLVTW